jgi:MarR family transcriptional regulator, lower aerobic nicotinate degradation pathway regulator
MDLYRTPGHLIRRCQQIAVAIFMDETAGAGVTPPQYAALAALAQHPGIDQRRLADAIAFDRSTIGDLVARLELRGLITRTAGSDRRTKRLTLTPEGEALLHGLSHRVERAQERILEPLSAAQRQQFIEMLAQVVHLHNESSRAPMRELTPRD